MTCHYAHLKHACAALVLASVPDTYTLSTQVQPFPRTEFACYASATRCPVPVEYAAMPLLRGVRYQPRECCYQAARRLNVSYAPAMVGNIIRYAPTRWSIAPFGTVGV
eukprot:1191555-Rhodomonas_salina.2